MKFSKGGFLDKLRIFALVCKAFHSCRVVGFIVWTTDLKVILSLLGANYRVSQHDLDLAGFAVGRKKPH